MGNIHYRQGDYEPARQAYVKALVSDKSLSHKWNLQQTIEPLLCAAAQVALATAPARPCSSAILRVTLPSSEERGRANIRLAYPLQRR
jgi:hypothetical protein